MAQTLSPVPGVAAATIPAAAVRGVASGVLFMAFLAPGGGGTPRGGWGGGASLWPSFVAVLIGITLLSGGIALLVASRRLPNAVVKAETEADARREKRTGILFGITFGAEGLLIGVASAVCHAINRVDLFFPLMALIVGVHFFPLAALFQVKIYYFVGALLCVLAIFTLLVVPQRVMRGGQAITAQDAMLGFGAALILWGVGVWLWLRGKRMLALTHRG